MSTLQSLSKLRVRYAETDQMGVVYYANYFVWFEVARTGLLREAGWSYREMEAEGFILPVVEAHCDYQQSARYDDDLDVRASGSAVAGPPAVRLRGHSLRRRRLAGGRTVHASLDRTGRPCRLPERVRELFMKALVTGAAGFIGSTLTERLLENGADVVGLDCFTDYYPRAVKERNLAAAQGHPRFRFVEAELQTVDLGTLLADRTHVFHLAAQAGVRKSWGRDFDVYTVNNVGATQKLLEACVGLPLERVVYASSSSVR